MSKEKVELTTLNVALAVLLLFLVGLSLYAVETIKKGTEPAKKPKIDAVLVLAECKECFNLEQAAQGLGQLPIELSVKKLNFSDKEAKKLVERYGIEKLPALILTGDTKDLPLEGFTEKKGALLLESPAPYIDAKTGTLKGKVSATLLLKKSCTNCVDLKNVVTQLKQMGLLVTTVTEIQAENGKELIQRYKITKAPTLLLSAEAIEYPVIKEVWEQIGSIEEDGMLVLREVAPPYYDLEKKSVQGIVDITLLTDKQCKECFDVSVLKQILEQNFAMAFGKEKTVDISSKEGKELVTRYEIKTAPTLIASKEAEAYQGIGEAWEQVGTKEKDGSYVFRKPELLQGIKYKDISTGEIKQGQEEGV